MDQANDINAGIAALKNAAENAPYAPGVYKMLSHDGQVIYVGKAKIIQKRVTQYTNIDKMPNRLKLMVSLVKYVEFFVTSSESEALILEAKLIKEIKPRFNILLKDDKSFPYIAIDNSHHFPKIFKYRGKEREDLELFGPFISSFHLDEIIILLQKLFLLRTCNDSQFSNRTRPCMLYQIKRCSAPCVGKVDKKEYNALLKAAIDVLAGNIKGVQANLLKKMENAALSLEFEKAAIARDEITSLKKISDRINIKGGTGDCHIFALYQERAGGCIQFTEIANSKVHDCSNMYFENTIEVAELPSLILNFYKSHKKKPNKILIDIDEDIEIELLSDVLSGFFGNKCKIINLTELKDLEFVNLIRNNVKGVFSIYVTNSSHLENINGLRKLLGIVDEIKRIEIYDNSHIFGSSAIGCMVVASQLGFEKSEYRTFKINSTDVGDDIKMMQEVIRRRMKREWVKPDLIIIDGGITQLNAVNHVLQDIGIKLNIISIAKGKKRNAGEEKIILVDGSEIRLPKGDHLLFYLQRLRDEAHRFAITTHRKMRDKKFISSEFDEIGFIGEKRRKMLQSIYGAPKSMLDMTLTEIENIPTFGKKMAKNLYVYLQQKKDI